MFQDVYENSTTVVGTTMIRRLIEKYEKDNCYYNKEIEKYEKRISKQKIANPNHQIVLEYFRGRRDSYDTAIFDLKKLI